MGCGCYEEIFGSSVCEKHRSKEDKTICCCYDMEYGPMVCEIHKKEFNDMDKQPKLDGKKNDEGKPQMGLVSTIFIRAIALILTIGVRKYGAHNWRQGMVWSRPYDALQRHLTLWWEGEDKDKESRQSHLWHAACELMFLVEYEARGLGKDDRWRGKP